MTQEFVTDRLHGVAAGLLTPFDEALDIDHDALAENADILYDRGIRTFLATANISEYHSLSQEERVRSAETAVDALPDDACILAGVGGSTGDAIELVRAYDRAGVDAMMIMPPDHSYIHERGLLTYYEKLAAASDRPLVPYMKGQKPSLEFAIDLCEMDAVVAIKYALEDAHFLSKAVDASPEEVVWVDGLAEPYAPEFYLAGAEGFSAGVSNFEPRVGLALFDALEAGDYERAAALRDVCLPYMDFRGTSGEDNSFPTANSIPAVKKGYELAGLNSNQGRVREPIRPLSQEDERRAEELYAQLETAIENLLEPDK